MSTLEVPRRTMGIVLLAMVAFIAAAVALFDAARLMGWLPTTVTTAVGELTFNLPDAQWVGALFEALFGAVWLFVGIQLWRLSPGAWLFVIIVAGLNLVLLLFMLLGQATFQALYPAFVVTGAALLIALLPSTQTAFLDTDRP